MKIENTQDFKAFIKKIARICIKELLELRISRRMMIGYRMMCGTKYINKRLFSDFSDGL